MPATGDTAPTFTATIGTSDHENFDLENHLGDGPVVLAFFPARSRHRVRTKWSPYRRQSDQFHDADATVLGVSADSPFSQGAFRDEHGIEFDLVSDMNGDAIEGLRSRDRHSRTRPLRHRQPCGVRPRRGWNDQYGGSLMIRRTNRLTMTSSMPSNRRREHSALDS